MAGFYASGHVVFLLLALMAVEAFLLRDTIRKVPMLGSGLVAGAGILLALRSALLDHSWPVIATFLLVGFVFHLWEVWQCLRLANRQSQ
jgi:ABC-type glycerol-3-phosphate transport system permease component